MRIVNERLDSGLVYFFAIAINRRHQNHSAVDEVAQWLNKHVYTRQAQQLISPEQLFLSAMKTAERKKTCQNVKGVGEKHWLGHLAENPEWRA